MFCGVGGLSHGFRQEKFKVIAGFDIDNSCRYAFETNNNAKFFDDDLSLTPSEKIGNLFPNDTIRVLVGCAPCQAFSTYSQKYKDNDKWKMLYTYGRIINDIQPEIISMENVPNLQNYKQGKVLEDFLSILKRNGYHINWKVVNSSLYGVPQNRKRLILLASKLGPIEFIKPTFIHRKITVREAIGHLPKIEDGETHSSDILHRARKLSPTNKKNQSNACGWRLEDWPEELILDCHKKESGKSFGSVYGRMQWDDVAPTDNPVYRIRKWQIWPS